MRESVAERQGSWKDGAFPCANWRCVATGLPLGQHVVRIRVLDPPDNGLPMKLAFHGFLLDAGAR